MPIAGEIVCMLKTSAGCMWGMSVTSSLHKKTTQVRGPVVSITPGKVDRDRCDAKRPDINLADNKIVRRYAT